MEEVWRDIKGYEGLYQVSNLGRVKSFSFKKEKIRKTWFDKNGYESVILTKSSLQKRMLIHRLVAEAFIPNPENLPCVNHKDENKQNNFVWVNPDGSVDLEKSNLEWCSALYNNCYGSRLEKVRVANTGRKMPREGVEKAAEKISKPVGAFKNGVLIKRYKSAAAASREDDNLNYISISAACHGRLKTYRGFKWEFIQ